jgi:hypothetical protein
MSGASFSFLDLGMRPDVPLDKWELKISKPKPEATHVIPKVATAIPATIRSMSTWTTMS